MSILITLLIAIVIVAALFYAIDLLSMDGRLANLLKVVVLAIAILVVLQCSAVI